MIGPRYTHYWGAFRILTDSEWYPIWSDAKKIGEFGAEFATYKARQRGEGRHITLDSLRPNEFSEFHLTAEKQAFCHARTCGEEYDILVTSVLLVAKKHQPEWIKLTSDGVWTDWEPAIELCRSLLKYQDTDFEFAKQDFDELLDPEDRVGTSLGDKHELP